MRVSIQFLWLLWVAGSLSTACGEGASSIDIPSDTEDLEPAPHVTLGFFGSSFLRSSFFMPESMVTPVSVTLPSCRNENIPTGDVSYGSYDEEDPSIRHIRIDHKSTTEEEGHDIDVYSHPGDDVDIPLFGSTPMRLSRSFPSRDPSDFSDIPGCAITYSVFDDSVDLTVLVQGDGEVEVPTDVETVICSSQESCFLHLNPLRWLIGSSMVLKIASNRLPYLDSQQSTGCLLRNTIEEKTGSGGQFAFSYEATVSLTDGAPFCAFRVPESVDGRVEVSNKTASIDVVYGELQSADRFNCRGDSSDDCVREFPVNSALVFEVDSVVGMEPSWSGDCLEDMLDPWRAILIVQNQSTCHFELIPASECSNPPPPVFDIFDGDVQLVRGELVYSLPASTMIELRDSSSVIPPVVAYTWFAGPDSSSLQVLGEGESYFVGSDDLECTQMFCSIVLQIEDRCGVRREEVYYVVSSP